MEVEYLPDQTFKADPEEDRLFIMRFNRLNQNFKLFIYPLSNGLNSIASVILFSIMSLTVADVFMRKTFSKSILGTIEMSEFMMVILVFFSLAQAELLGRHVKVDLVMKRFGKRTQEVVDMIIQFICFLLFGAITWYSLAYASNMKVSKEVSLDLLIPKYPFIYAVVVGCALLPQILLIQFLTLLKKLVSS